MFQLKQVFKFVKNGCERVIGSSKRGLAPSFLVQCMAFRPLHRVKVLVASHLQLLRLIVMQDQLRTSCMPLLQ